MGKMMIPMRPKGKYIQLDENAMDCLTWHVISGRKLIDCFIAFVRPDLKGSKGAKQWYDQFVAYADVRNYIKDYTETLLDYFSSLNNTKQEEDDDETKNTFRQNVKESVNQRGITDVEVLSAQATLLNKIGLLKEEDEVQMAPQRYLPERCNSCSYKQFIDEQVKEGNIIEEN